MDCAPPWTDAKIAVALKGGEWRKTSMVMLAKAFATSDASASLGENSEEELKHLQQVRQPLLRRRTTNLSRKSKVEGPEGAGGGRQRGWLGKGKATAVITATKVSEKYPAVDSDKVETREPMNSFSSV